MKVILGVIIAAAAGLPAQTVPPLGEICPIKLEAAVQQGPNAGKLKLAGTLVLTETEIAGEAQGTFFIEQDKTAAEAPREVPVKANILNHMVGMILPLADGVSIIGTGMMVRS